MKVKEILPILRSSHIAIMRYREFYNDWKVVAVEESCDHCSKEYIEELWGEEEIAWIDYGFKIDPYGKKGEGFIFYMEEGLTTSQEIEARFSGVWR